MSGTGCDDSVAGSADPAEAVRVDEALERAPARGEPLGPLHRLEVREADIVVQRDRATAVGAGRAGARGVVGGPEHRVRPGQVVEPEQQLDGLEPTATTQAFIIITHKK